MMSYAEFKRLDVYKTANVIKFFNEDGIDINSIPEEELNGMDVTAYFAKDGVLTIELAESISDFEDFSMEDFL